MPWLFFYIWEFWVWRQVVFLSTVFTVLCTNMVSVFIASLPWGIIYSKCWVINWDSYHYVNRSRDVILCSLIQLSTKTGVKFCLDLDFIWLKAHLSLVFLLDDKYLWSCNSNWSIVNYYFIYVLHVSSYPFMSKIYFCFFYPLFIYLFPKQTELHDPWLCFPNQLILLLKYNSCPGDPCFSFHIWWTFMSVFCINQLLQNFPSTPLSYSSCHFPQIFPSYVYSNNVVCVLQPVPFARTKSS